MRLLPRTTRGIVTLAAAAWLAGAALLWVWLPVGPRATWSVSRSSFLVGLTPGGRMLVTWPAEVADEEEAARNPLPPPGPITFWDAASGRRLGSWAEAKPGSPEGMVLSPDGHWLAVEDESGDKPRLRLRDLRTAEVREFPDADSRPGRGWQFSPDGRYLVYGGNDPLSLRVWDLSTGRVRGELNDAGPWFRFAPGGGRLVAGRFPEGGGHQNGTRVGVWNLDRLTLAATLTLPSNVLDELALSPDGRSLVGLCPLGGSDRPREARCWDVATGRERFRVSGVESLAWVRDGATLVTNHRPLGEAAFLQFRDGSTGRPRGRVDLRHGEVADRGTDGRTLAVEGERPRTAYRVEQYANRSGLPWPFVRDPERVSVVRLLEAATGRPLGEFPAELVNAAWSPDGQSLAVMQPDNVVQLWDVPPRKPLGLFLALAVPLAGLTAWRIRRLRVLA